MFQKILVPTDFSEKSRRALDIAVEVAQSGQGIIYLLHVIKIIPHVAFEDFKSFYTNLENRANQEMDKLLAPYPEKSITIESRIVFGDRVHDIVKFAEDYEIDLIVMNSHQVDLNNPVQGWGTISYKVGVLSHCPILLVK